MALIGGWVAMALTQNLVPDDFRFLAIAVVSHTIGVNAQKGSNS